MSREYRNIKEYEKEIIEMYEKGLTKKEIGKKFGLKYKQIDNCVYRYHVTQKKLASGITIKPKGRPKMEGELLPPSIQQLSRLSQLQYEISRKETQIKRLEMENALMRDFLSLTERK